MHTILVLIWFICHSTWCTTSMIWFALHFTQSSWELLHFMTDPASGHESAGDASIDADQVSALGIGDHDQSVALAAPVLQMKIPVFLPVFMLKRRTKMVLRVPGGITGATVSVSVRIFPGHRHMIAFLVIHQDNAVSENARCARNGFPPRRMRRDGQSTSPNNIRSLPACCHNHRQMQCHKQGSSKQYSRIVHLFFPSMCYKSMRMLLLITLWRRPLLACCWWTTILQPCWNTHKWLLQTFINTYNPPENCQTLQHCPALGAWQFLKQHQLLCFSHNGWVV